MGIAVGNKGYLPGVVAAVITLVVFLPAIRNGFVGWDDPVYVTANSHIQRIDADFFRWAFFGLADMPLWIPLTWISFAGEHALWGLDPRGYHLTNILLHSLNVFLVFLVSVRLLRAYYTSKETSGRSDKMAYKMIEACALMTALFFGLHPLRVESVAWVTERKDVLSGFFGLSAILMYIKYAARRSDFAGLAGRLRDFRYAASLLLFVLSLMSKPMTITLPVVFLILDWFPLAGMKRVRFARAVGEKTPFFIAALVSGVLTLITQQPGMLRFDDISLWPRVLQAFKSVTTYLLLMLRPAGLAAFYDHPGGTASIFRYDFLLPIILFALVSAACFILAKSNRLWLAVWLYYLATLLPVIGIFQAGAHAMGDRFTYLPSIGPAFLASICIAALIRKTSGERDFRKAFSGMIIVAVVISLAYFAAASSRQIAVWRDNETLWTHAINERPDSAARAYLQRSVEYSRTGRYEDALKDMNASLEIQKRMNYCRIDKAYFLRGNVLLELKRFAEAVDDFNRAIELNPHEPEAAYFEKRGSALAAVGMLDRAERDREASLHMHRGNI